jgi:Asp-tRNA(Asn)/Glu-tRNA(Gln) amidotransferase A subunit family amidase
VGSPSTWGFPQFRNYMPSEDALVVTCLKEAGAVIIGKANFPVAALEREFGGFVPPPMSSL